MRRICGLFTSITYLLSHCSLVRTIYFNFKFFPFKTAWRMPILLGKKIQFRSLKGEIRIDSSNISPAMIKLGFCQIFRDDSRKSTILDLNGVIIFKGSAIFHPGCILSVDNKATMSFGDNYKLGADSILHARKCIEFGDNVNISWNFQAIDTDFHYVKNVDNGNVYNNTSPIIIGNNVWIGNHVSIGKGVSLPKGTIVSAKSHVNKSIETEDSIVGGIPAKLLKTGFNRVFALAEEAEYDLKFGNN